MEPLVGKGTTAVAMAVQEGHVIMKFPAPVSWLKMEPQQALEAAGWLVRAGMEAKTGRSPTDIVVSRMIVNGQTAITL